MNTEKNIKEKVKYFRSQEIELKNELINEIKKEFETYDRNIINVGIFDGFDYSDDEEITEFVNRYESEKFEEIQELLNHICPFYPTRYGYVDAYPGTVEKNDGVLKMGVCGEFLDPNEDKIALEQLAINDLFCLLQILQSDIMKKFHEEIW